MTGPKEPGDDWGFPEVGPTDTGPAETADDGPTSTSLPEPETQVFDTGSDAWWRQQAEAQRKAAAGEPVIAPTPPTPSEPVPPPELVEPEVLNAPSPLDEEWLPPELPATEPEPPAEEPLPADWFRGLVEPTTAASVAESMPEAMPETEPAAIEHEARTRQPHEGQRVGPGRALAGAALALLGVLLAIGALIVFNGNSEPKGGPTVGPAPSESARPSASPSATRGAAPTATAPVVVPATPAEAAIVPVRVLNNSRIQHLADRAADRFRAGGWPVPQTGNYRGGTISTTTVYYPPGQRASAVRFAKQFGIPRVALRFAGIPVPGMTVILTRDYHP